MDDRKRQFAELLAHDTLESTRIRLESFADAFERLARGPKQRALSDEFSHFVSDYVRQPLSMADLNGLTGLGHRLEIYADKFGQLGSRAEYKEMVRELEHFREDCIAAHENWSRSGERDVQHPTMTRAVAQELIGDIEKLTSRQFVYDSRFGGLVPAGDALSERQTGPPTPFGELHWQLKANVLRDFVKWDHYDEHGLHWRDHATIEYNVACGKPADRWLEGTSFIEPSQQLAEGKPRPAPLAGQFQEMLGQPVADAAREGVNMDRDKLIRAHFDAYSDHSWVTNLEPKFREYNLNAVELEEHREAWNRHTEGRDWEWWLENVKNMPNAELKEEIAKRRAEIDAFRKGPETDAERFQNILDANDTTQPLQPATKDRGREM
jgi:hypothetical protein